jgi:hypothetical protein
MPGGKNVRFCSIWQVDTGTDVPRFITMYPLYTKVRRVRHNADLPAEIGGGGLRQRVLEIAVRGEIPVPVGPQQCRF